MFMNLNVDLIVFFWQLKGCYTASTYSLTYLKYIQTLMNVCRIYSWIKPFSCIAEGPGGTNPVIGGSAFYLLVHSHSHRDKACQICYIKWNHNCIVPKVFEYNDNNDNLCTQTAYHWLLSLKGNISSEVHSWEPESRSWEIKTTNINRSRLRARSFLWSFTAKKLLSEMSGKIITQV